MCSQSGRHGVSLVEVMVSIAIIGIVVALMLPPSPRFGNAPIR